LRLCHIVYHTTARAMSNSQLASYLHISEGTVERHLSNIYAKFGASSRSYALKKALTSGRVRFEDLSGPAP
jgi:DNA-binding CsgD family transcriptional regulator